MNTQSTIQLVRSFAGRSSPFGKLTVEVSDPWHFNHCQGTNIPFQNAGKGGIYLLTEPGEHWDQVAESNYNPVWYIGTSQKNVGGRVWDHVGSIYDEETGAQNVPRFKHHRWADIASIDESIRERVSEGDIVVYTIAISSENHDQSYLLPALLEKYVLVEFVMASGKLPPLNLGV